MSLTTWVLAGLTALAGALCILALLDERHEPAPKRVAQHGRWVGEGDTRRLSQIEAPTEIISRGRCRCLHLAHIGRCRGIGPVGERCGCVSPQGYTDPGTL